MNVAETINVEVAYALPTEQLILPINVNLGTTAGDAVMQSGMLDKFPDIDLEKNKIGVFGKAVKRDAILKAGDRVEIYRPLIADPKEVRRQRAKEGKAKQKGENSAES